MDNIETIQIVQKNNEQTPNKNENQNNISRRGFLTKLGMLAMGVAIGELDATFRANEFQCIHLINDDRCEKSKNLGFTPLERLNSEVFSIRDEIVDNLCKSTSTEYFDKYGLPENYIFKLVKDLTGKDLEVKIEYNDDLDFLVGARYNPFFNKIELRNPAFEHFGYLVDEDKFNNYGYINRLLTLAHEAGHSFKGFLRSVPMENLKNSFGLSNSKLSEIQIAGEAIASLFVFSVANYLIEEKNIDQRIVKYYAYMNSNFELFEMNVERGKDRYIMSPHLSNTANEHYNGGLLSCALINLKGCADKAFNDFILNTEISDEIYNEMMKQYKIIYDLKINEQEKKELEKFSKELSKTTKELEEIRNEEDF